MALVVGFLMFSPIFSLAQESSSNTPPPGGNTPPAYIKNPLERSGINDIPKFLLAILNGVVRLAIPLVALAVIYSGFLFVKAQGNPEEIGKAKDAILYTLIGAAVLLGALAIARLVSDTILAL